MHISPHNPHYRKLKESLIDDWTFWKSNHLRLRSTIQGLTPNEYLSFQKEFPFLSQEELAIVIQNIIAWYRAGEAIRQISWKL